ncbi:hypothetical protein KR018_004390 [Drosophila ironensis]|nr:hypothetical protein KR018_004390 [Drosophila ironensis]
MELRLVLVLLCLLLPSGLSVKIGISLNYNTTAVPPTRSTTPADFQQTTTNEVASSVSPMPVATSSPGSLFPPRPQTKPRATTAPSTTPKPKASPKVPAASNSTPIAHSWSDNFCSCDVQEGQCNLNCCCDQDCSQESRRVFDCQAGPSFPGLQSRLQDFQYEHGLPTCQINDGWLCVFRSNAKPTQEHPLSSNFDATRLPRWPDLLEAYEAGPATAHPLDWHYKLGQPLQVWLPSEGQVGTFEIPTAYESSHCQMKQAVRHLQPTSSHCLLKDAAQLQENLWDILNYTASRVFLSKPRDPEEPDQDGISIQVCQRDIEGKFQCLGAGNDSQPTDVLADSLELQLVHNFTNILEAKLLISSDENPPEDENEPLWMHFEVKFISANEPPAKPTSGPLGYLSGSPLIFSRNSPLNNSGDQQQLGYFHDPHEYHWLPLLKRKPRSRTCQRVLGEEQALRFGMDLERHCLLYRAAPVLQESANHTEYCQDLQAHIWSLLLPHNCSQLDEVAQVFASPLGKPQMDKWLPVQIRYPGNGNEVPPVHGSFDEVQQSLSCRNIFLSVRYEFHVAEVTLLEGRAAHQQVLQHAKLVLGQGHDLEFDASEQQVALPLSVSAMFYKMQRKPLTSGVQSSLLDHVLLAALLGFMIA